MRLPIIDSFHIFTGMRFSPLDKDQEVALA